MIAYLALLFPWLGCDPADLERFPGYSVIDEQLGRMGPHKERLETLRNVHGWQGGRWDDALDSLEFSRQYWLALAACHDTWLLDPAGQRKRLYHLKLLIGPERYRDGWRPVLIPGSWEFEKGPMPRANP